jgi:hypothetical protein
MAMAIAPGISSDPGTLMRSTSAPASCSAFIAPAKSASAISS